MRRTQLNLKMMEDLLMKKLINFMLNMLTVVSMVSSVYCAEGTTLVEKMINTAANSSISYETALVKVHNGKVQF